MKALKKSSINVENSNVIYLSKNMLSEVWDVIQLGLLFPLIIPCVMRTKMISLYDLIVLYCMRHIFCSSQQLQMQHIEVQYTYIYNSSYSYNNYFCSLIRVELVKINLPYKSLFVLYRIGQEKIQRGNCSIYRFEAVWLGLAVSHLLKPRLKCKQVITKSQCH